MKYLVITLAIMISGSVCAQKYSLASSDLSIHGTSNVHEWQSNAKEVRANADISFADDGTMELSSLYVEIPVRSIKSEKGSIMDGKTYDALKADKHRNITFQMTKVDANTKSGSSYNVKVSGKLTIAGVTKTVQLAAKGTVDSNGNITFKGSEKLKMTSYGIKPPTALLGTMTTGDDVEIKFNIRLKKS
ncbi:MAG: YceI family protein [Saprospiraceae bacterium]